MPVNTAPNTSIASTFHALSDPLRINIIELLREQELCVCELCDRLQMPQSKLSFHLKTLKDAGIVQARQESRWIYYSLNCQQIGLLQQYLAGLQNHHILAAKSCEAS